LIQHSLINFLIHPGALLQLSYYICSR